MVECIKIENCYAHAQTYAYLLPGPVSEALISKLEPLGQLEIKRNFRRPFFFLRLPDGAEIRGALGDDRMKASFPNENAETCRAAFCAALSAILEDTHGV